ncbi:MAG: glycosyltransferase family 4 protein [Chloroflexi bacterium]|nr:glycosyltransferase family 4 protein [Chloroflexota bacterium]
MRVLMVSKACVVGAYQRNLEELARLPEVELTVGVPPLWRDRRGNTTRLERTHTEGYRLEVLPIRFNGHFHLHHYPGLGRLMRALRPQILHMDEEPYNLATFLAVRQARQVGARVVFFTWQNLQRRYPPPFSWMEGAVYRTADHALAGNQEAVAVLRNKGYRGPVTVLPQFGVDPQIFRPGPAQENAAGEFVIGYAGRLVPEKGVDLLLRAAAGLSGAWQVQVLGEGPSRPALQALTAELGVADRVRFAAARPSGEMPDWYRGLDALALPSLTRANWKEQFGRVLVEAMACAVPVVGAQSGEIPHVIGRAGLTFPEGDVAALQGHLQRLHDDGAQRAALGQAGRQRVLEQFTQAQVAARTYAVYRQMLGMEPAGGA